ncbi:hypothetical protein [Sphingomonas psychrolutea]|nr:hypothetical protein [Sphingomonas psychrolutea]
MLVESWNVEQETMMSKPLIALVATVALTFPALAQAQRAPVVPNATFASEMVCSISSEGGVSSLDYSFGASNAGSTPSKGGMSVDRGRGGWDLAPGKGRIVDETLRVISSPSSNGGPPKVTAHAINTKGMGSGNRSSGDGSPLSPQVCAHAIKSKGAGGPDVRTTPAMMGGITGGMIACRINPGKGVTIFNLPPPPILDKVSMQDFRFVNSSEADRLAAAGPGGGPHVQAIVCSSGDGVPGSVSMLLLPAVQK